MPYMPCRSATWRLVPPVHLTNPQSQEVRRASRAWPLAWPSPSGPLGWQRLRRSRVGPEDRFCEAVRNDLRVPLTLEGPARTMRGVPARWLWISSRLPALLAQARRPGRGAGGRGSGIRRGPQAAGHRGAVRGSRRAVGLASEGRGESCRPATARPRVNLSRLRRVTLAAHSPRLLVPVLAAHGWGRQARRAEGAPLKP
jgi:hypothetical protein